METSLTGSSISSQIIKIGSALNRVETILRHIQVNLTQQNGTVSEFALVPLPGTQKYYDWLSILLQHRSSMGSFLQGWLRDAAETVGGSPVRRVRTIAAHLCAPPMVVNVW